MNDFRRAPAALLLLCLLALLTSCSGRPQAPTALDAFPPPPAAEAEAEAVAPPPGEEQAEEPVARTEPEPEQTVDLEIKELEELGDWSKRPETAPEKITYDFPVVITPQVEFYLDFFQNRQRATFRRWLARSGRYLPLIRQELRAAGLPLDLAYLPMIESGYTLTAYSKARAVGLWQFIRPTARHFGLTVNEYLDERRDPVKSTKAAIRYLSELYEQFGSWHLAVAAYNAGEGKILKAIKRYRTKDFWQIAEKRYLRLETKRYVPKLIAAIIIARSPEKYGFADISYQPPLAYDTVGVPRWTPLAAVAAAIGRGVGTDDLRRLNPQLVKGVSPAVNGYKIKVPAGTAELAARNLPRVHAVVTTRYKTHIIRQGDTIGKICRRYRINKTTLLKANNLRAAKLLPGRRLRIPYRSTRYVLLTDEEFANRRRLAEEAGNFILHTIRKGESLSGIARRYGVTTRQIAAWNGLENMNRIRAGQQLALYIDRPVTVAAATGKGRAAAAGEKSPKVALLTADNIKAKPRRRQYRSTYYRVRGGDSLWRIARRFRVKTSDIKRWNNLKDNTIHPGLKLLLKVKI